MQQNVNELFQLYGAKSVGTLTHDEEDKINELLGR